MQTDLEQERDVEDDQRGAALGRPAQEPVLNPPDQRVDDPFQPAQRRRVAEDPLAQQAAVDRAVFDRTRKGLGDRRDRRPARSHDPVNGAI